MNIMQIQYELSNKRKNLQQKINNYYYLNFISYYFKYEKIILQLQF